MTTSESSRQPTAWRDAEWFAAGVEAFQSARLDDALAAFAQALACNPQHLMALNYSGILLYRMRRLDDAIAAFEHVLAVDADNFDALNNCGKLLMQASRLEESEKHLRRALELSPDNAFAWNNLGNTLRFMGKLDAALVCFRRAAELNPSYATPQWNESMVLLLQGDFDAGWKKYELRWAVPDFTSERRNFSQPLWLGQESITGKTILLHAEQGLGDTVQFCRYVPMVAALGASAIVEAEAPLLPLLQTLAGAFRLTKKGDPLPAFDCHCPLMSLPLALGTTPETIPSAPSYLHALPERVEKWRAKLPRTKPVRIGISWSGNPNHVNDRYRSIALERLLAIMPSEAEVVGLQRDLREEDAAALDRFPNFTHAGNELADFADTAALTDSVDLAIAIDSVISHVAGALGKPAWILAPFHTDFRWPLDRKSSPWYPSATVFRQTRAGDWSEPLAEIEKQLAALMN